MHEILKKVPITEGQIEVVKASTGREVLLNVLGPVEVVGEIALLENKPRMASVRARTDSKLLAISKEQFEHLLEVSASAARAMFYTILARWRSTEAMLRQGEKWPNWAPSPPVSRMSSTTPRRR